MKIIRFKWNQTTQYGIIRDNDVLSLEGDILGDFSAGGKICSLDDVELLPPVDPGLVVGLGGNYHSLLAVDTSVHSKPESFIKPRSAVIGHLGNIIYPKNIVDNVHMEAELAFIVKREATHVPEGKGKDYILGYTCANDVTAHISSDRGHTRSKGFYTFCPIGPCIETDLDPDNTTITSWLNGELVQDHDPTSGMVYNINKIVSYITEYMTLNPLDVVLTGTARPPAQLTPGDVVEIEVEGIGKLKNSVIE